MSTNSPLTIVLAAGQGTRMESPLPKVLVQACGRPLIEYVLEALQAASLRRMLVVVGYQADAVRAALAGRQHLAFVEQSEQLGTGHAVMMCRPQLVDHDGAVLVVTGDSPLIRPASIRALLQLYQRERPACILGTLIKEDPSGLGRIVRDPRGEFMAIVEERDASAAQRKIREVNMSTYVFDCKPLLRALDQLGNQNRQREYYITDCPGILKADEQDVRALPVLQPCEAHSVNNLAELAALEDEMRKLGFPDTTDSGNSRT